MFKRKMSLQKNHVPFCINSERGIGLVIRLRCGLFYSYVRKQIFYWKSCSNRNKDERAFLLYFGSIWLRFGGNFLIVLVVSVISWKKKTRIFTQGLPKSHITLFQTRNNFQNIWRFFFVSIWIIFIFVENKTSYDDWKFVGNFFKFIFYNRP